MDAMEERILEVAVDDGKTARDHNEQMKVIKRYLLDGTYPRSYTKNQKRVVRKALGKGQYELEGGKLYYNTHVGQASRHLNKRLVVVTDKKEKMRLLWHCHTVDLSAHAGVNATQQKLGMTHYWRGMKEDVRRYCQAKLILMAPDMKPIKVVGPWHTVEMDLVGPLKVTPRGNQYILTLTDYFTKFVDFHAIPIKSGEAVAKALETFFLRWGAPEELLSDQEGEFINQINQALAEKFKVNRMVTSAYRPQSNGLEEKTNQTLRDRLERLVNDQQDDWDTLLDQVAFSMRNQKQKSTKFTPFFLMFRRKVWTPQYLAHEEGMEVKLDELEKAVTEEDVSRLVERTENHIKAVDEQVLKNMQEEEHARRKMKGVGVFDLRAGQLLLGKNMQTVAERSRQFEASWIGPYTISTNLSEGQQLRDVLKLQGTPAGEEEETSHCKEESKRDMQPLLVMKEEHEEEDWNVHVDQEDIKEEEEKLWISQQLEEADLTKFGLTVKSENEDEKPESSSSPQIHQSHSDDITEAEPVACSSSEHRTLTAQDDGEDHGGPQPARNLGPNSHLEPDTSSGTETDDNYDWKQTRELQSGFNCGNNISIGGLRNWNIAENQFSCTQFEKAASGMNNSEQHKGRHVSGKPFSCSFQGKRQKEAGTLYKYRRIQAGKKPFDCSECGQRFAKRCHLNRHMIVHTGEKPFSCSECNRRFGRKSSLDRHMRIHPTSVSAARRCLSCAST